MEVFLCWGVRGLRGKVGRYEGWEKKGREICYGGFSFSCKQFLTFSHTTTGRFLSTPLPPDGSFLSFAPHLQFLILSLLQTFPFPLFQVPTGTFFHTSTPLTVVPCPWCLKTFLNLPIFYKYSMFFLSLFLFSV